MQNYFKPSSTNVIKIRALSVIAAASLSFATIAVVQAKDNRRHDDKQPPIVEMRLLKSLDISSAQKQSIKDIIKQTREDNSVYKGEKDAIKQQIEFLMQQAQWDQELAAQIVSTQMQQGQAVALNRAEARHQIYSLLTTEQQAQLAEKKSKIKDKTKDKRKKRANKSEKRFAKMAEKLELSKQQIADHQAIREQLKADLQELKATLKAHKQAERALIQSPSFDENAWLQLQAEYADAIASVRVLKMKAKYDSFSLLTEQQKESFKERMQKKKGPRRQAN